jgi:pectinesterase
MSFFMKLVVAAWIAVPSVAAVHVVVSQDGKGDFKTIQMAIDHAPLYGEDRLVIEIRPGIYHERVMVPQDRPRVTFLGQDAATTVITYSMSATAAGGTFFSSVVHIEANEFQAENITFENSYGVGSQAVAISVQSDKAEFRKCRFLGWQDTVYANRGRQYYKDCYIAGHVDFIFGNATAVFDRCEIHSLGAGYVTAQSRLTADGATGYVFYNCNLTGENTGKGVFLGRPWRPYSRVVFIDCAMGAHIRPEGWDNWRSAENEKTAFYGEYGSKGPGAEVTKRAPWAHALTAEQAKSYAPSAFLQGWKP